MGLKSWIGASLLVAAGAAQALPVVYKTGLVQEAGATPATGAATLVYDPDAAVELTLSFYFFGLSTPSTVAHIHCCTGVPGTGTAGVAVDQGTLPGFPAGVTEFSYTNSFDLDDVNSYGNDFVTNNGGTAAGARAALLAGLANGSAYLNIHSERFRGGEIRGFFAIPEPPLAALLALSLAGLALTRRRV